MKHPKIMISIPEPCQEDWNEMTPTQKGKFCGVCTKEVVDFTVSSDENIVKHFQKNDNVCGRFLTSQLDPKLIVDRKQRNHWLSYAASFLLPITLFSQEIKKDTKNTPKTEQTNTGTYTSLNIGSLHKKGEVAKKTKKDAITVNGIISDESGLPLPGATIKIKGTNTGTTTDFDGNYNIVTKINDVLIASYTGYESLEIKVTNKNHNFSLKQDNSLVEVQILPYHTQRLGKVIGSVTTINPEDITILSDSITVSGVITDESGLPLPGATIVVKNTTNGVATDFDGNYKINMKRNDILVISYIGYESTEIKVTQNTHNAQLASDNSLAEIVLVVGAVTSPRWIEHHDRPLTKEQKENKKRIENYFAFQKKKWKEKREKRRARRAARKAEKAAKHAKNKG